MALLGGTINILRYRRRLGHFLHGGRRSQNRVQLPLVTPPNLMQSEGNARKDQQQQQISRVQSGCLEDRLHQGDVDQTQLHDERDRDGRDEHLVLGDSATETAVLNGGDQIEEDETCERLRGGRSQLLQKPMYA